MKKQIINDMWYHVQVFETKLIVLEFEKNYKFMYTFIHLLYTNQQAIQIFQCN